MLTKLGEYLKISGETQERFADRAGVPAPMVSVWSRFVIRGGRPFMTRRPALENALKIADATKNGDGDPAVPASYWTTLRVCKPARRFAASRI